MVDLAITFAGGVAIGIIADRILLKLSSDKKVERSKILEECFGSPMYASTFSLIEVRDWIKSRESSMSSGSKVIVLKANDETLKTIGKELAIGSGVDNLMVLAIVDEQKKEISNSALIKYDKLDEQLETSLAKGNGVLVIEV